MSTATYSLKKYGKARRGEANSRMGNGLTAAPIRPIFWAAYGRTREFLMTQRETSHT